MASLPSAERHGSWGAASYSQTRCLLAPKTDTIDCEAQPYEVGNRALSHLDADGVFYIRGVRYTMVSKDEGGYIGGGAYGKVWLAKRDADAPMHDLRFHERDLVSELLNRPEICVKVFRVEKSKGARGGIASARDARREMQLHARAGHYVHGVMSILAVTDIPAGMEEGPVTIDPKWTGGDLTSRWVVMACEIARQGNLRRFISPLNSEGKTLLTQVEGLQENRGLGEMAAVKVVNDAVQSESLVASLQVDDLARGVMYRLLKQLDRLHTHGILHLDLKPENITINERWEVCIIDFGLARPINDPTLNSRPMLGTLGFRAPEMFGSEKADVFSAGMILYGLITSAENPFFGTHPIREPLNSVYRSFLANSYLCDKKSDGVLACVRQLQQWYPEGHPYRPRLQPSSEAASLVAMMVSSDPNKRFTVKDCLKHQWFQSHSQFSDSEFRCIVKKSVSMTGDALPYWKGFLGSKTAEEIEQARKTFVEDVENKILAKSSAEAEDSKKRKER